MKKPTKPKTAPLSGSDAEPAIERLDLRTARPRPVAVQNEQFANALENPAYSTKRDMSDSADERLKYISEVWPKLSEPQRDCLSAQARLLQSPHSTRLQARAAFMSQSMQTPDRPMRYVTKPNSMDAVEFMEMEYVAKGMLKQGFNRKSLKALDPSLAQWVHKEGQRYGLPPHLDIPKAKKRTNKREQKGEDL